MAPAPSACKPLFQEVAALVALTSVLPCRHCYRGWRRCRRLLCRRRCRWLRRCRCSPMLRAVIRSALRSTPPSAFVGYGRRCVRRCSRRCPRRVVCANVGAPSDFCRRCCRLLCCRRWPATLSALRSTLRRCRCSPMLRAVRRSALQSALPSARLSALIRRIAGSLPALLPAALLSAVAGAAVGAAVPAAARADVECSYAGGRVREGTRRKRSLSEASSAMQCSHGVGCCSPAVGDAAGSALEPAVGGGCTHCGWASLDVHGLLHPGGWASPQAAVLEVS